MANHEDSSQDKNVQEKGQDGGENESPGRERRDITPTPQVPGEGDAAKEMPGEGSAEAKRGGNDGASASSSGADKKRKKGELLEIPNGSPVCYLCGREFQSWKGVFGHMRAHKIGEERVRGAFPPPVFTPPASPQREETDSLQKQLAPVLLNIAQEILQRSHGAGPRGLNIDLNEQPPAQSESSSASSPSSPDKGGDTKLDLNKPPSPEGGNGDDGASSVS
ncbi:uncharacterized protein LOC123199518 [Mangifera indica]|uniref:uncharacterized protein LOC123199518 n=1 Tax=Mangifera indica TaxID=29780 RepID=UPI001CF9ECD4|nr:uncharacterized protein LOC123199518 [Mangifera indica]